MKKWTIQFKISLEENHFLYVDENPIKKTDEVSENQENNSVNQLISEDSVDLLVKQYIKQYNLKGCPHDIKVFDGDGILIARAENLSERGNLKYVDENNQ